jgi:hypothetical protein
VEAADGRHLADPAAPDDFSRLLAKRVRPALNSDLDDALGFVRRLDHRPPFGHDERQWLLNVHVLAGAAGVDHLQRVPVVGGGNDDGVHVLAIEELVVVVELIRVRADLLGGEVEVWLIEVADRDDLRVLVGEERVEHLVAAIAQADEADADAIVGAEHAAGAQGRHRHRGTGGGMEISAGNL